MIGEDDGAEYEDGSDPGDKKDQYTRHSGLNMSIYQTLPLTAAVIMLIVFFRTRQGLIIRSIFGSCGCGTLSEPWCICARNVCRKRLDCPGGSVALSHQKNQKQYRPLTYVIFLLDFG